VFKMVVETLKLLNNYKSYRCSKLTEEVMFGGITLVTFFTRKN
jgi:hypothetical protein